MIRHLPSSNSESLSDNSLSEEEEEEEALTISLFFSSLFNTTPAEKCVLKCLTGRICTHWNKNFIHEYFKWKLDDNITQKNKHYFR